MCDVDCHKVPWVVLVAKWPKSKVIHPKLITVLSLRLTLPLSLTHLFSTLHDGNFSWSADRWQKLLFRPRTSVFCPAYWSPATSCPPAFVCVSVHVSLPLLLFALLHVIAVPDSAVGPHSLTVQVIKKSSISTLWKVCVVKPRVWCMDQMSVFLVIPNDHLWKGRLTQKWQNLHSIVSPAGSNGCLSRLLLIKIVKWALIYILSDLL